MGASTDENYNLQWNDFAEKVTGAFQEFRQEGDFFDVTLACMDSGSKPLQAHKVILSACSNFFKSIFRQQTETNKHPNPYIYLRGVTYDDLTSILDFIYNGEVNIAQNDLNDFLAVAEELQIKGLTNQDNENSSGNFPEKSVTASRRRKSTGQEEAPEKKIRKMSPVPSTSIQKIKIKDETETKNPNVSNQELRTENSNLSFDDFKVDDYLNDDETPEPTLNAKEVMDYLEQQVDENGKEIKLFKCLLCNKIANDRSNMRRHMIVTHAKPINKPCPFKCGKIFKHKFTLSNHVTKKQCPKIKEQSESENGDTSYNDYYEGSNAAEMVDVEISSVETGTVETGDGGEDLRPVSSEDVEELMKFRQALTRYDDEGREVKYFKCGLCQKESSNHSNMRRHLLTQHTKPINQQCPFKCGKIFQNKIALSKHIKKKQCAQSKDESNLDPVDPSITLSFTLSD